MDIDLDKPAFGVGSEKIEDGKTIITEPSVEEGDKSEENDGEPSVEETKVSYSRFKNVNEARREAEAEAERWRLKAEELESKRAESKGDIESDDAMPSEWVELYGNSEASEKAWKVQARRERAIEQRAYEAGQRGAQELEGKQRERINSNIAKLDENFEDLSAFVGRELTDKEQSSILDIIDDYTAQDKDGKYIGAVLPFDKAWEIYELKNGKSSQTRQSRDSVASLSGTSSRGDTTINAERNKSFDPLNWRAYEDRL